MNKLSKLARKFQIKYGQDPFAPGYVPPPPSKEEVEQKAREEKDRLQQEEQRNYHNVLMAEWAKENNHELPLSDELQGEMFGDPEFYNKWNSFYHNQKKREEMEKEFTQQDKDIAQQQADEQAQREAYQKSIAGKTPFTKQDADLLVRQALPELKKLAPNLTGIYFTFTPTEILVSGTNPDSQKIASNLRNKIAMSLLLSMKQYLIVYKKYWDSQRISSSVQ